GGGFQRSRGPAVPGTLPARIVAGDLNGDGRQDLVVSTIGSDSLLVYLQALNGFGPPAFVVDAGVCASALALVDVDGRDGLDLVVSDFYAGEVRALLNGGADPFTTVRRYRAGNGLSAVTEYQEVLTPHSREGTVGLVGGDFDRDGFADLVVLNSGVNRFAL